jgi:hypothetical protein
MQGSELVPPEAALDFINRVEAWKAMGIAERVKGRGRNTAAQALTAIQGAITQHDPGAQIEALLTLVGFGWSQHRDYGTHPAKVATAALRFLRPVDWGVVDWRSGAVASTLKDGVSIAEAAHLLRRKGREYWVDALSHIDSQWAVALNAKYRSIGQRFGVPRNADVDQFLFAITLELWPLDRKHG